MPVRRLLRVKHEHRVINCADARVVMDDLMRDGWCLRVESPAEIGPFREHLAKGSAMALNMITRDGDHLVGEACVADMSDGIETAAYVTLTGMGPLRHA